VVPEIAMKGRTLGAILRLQAERQPHKPFLLFEGTSTTYGEADTLAATVALNLQSHGVRKGEHVAVFMDNHPEMLWTMFGLAVLGAVTVPLNTAAKGDQLLYFLRQSKASVLVVDEHLLPQIVHLMPDLPGLARIFVRGSGPDGYDSSKLRGATDFRTLMKPVTAESPLAPVLFSDVQLIMYTSGTTGPSKGVLCTHSQEQTGGLFMAEQMGYGEDDVLYTCLPLFHANALRVTVNAALWAGATVALARRFSARQFWSDIRSSSATQFNALGAMANIILRQPASSDDADHKVRLCNVVPALPPDIEQEFSRRFGLKVTSMYGSTEACCPLFAVDAPREKGTTCGRLVEPFDVRVVDDDDFELPHGQVGEWLIRCREPWYIFQGYFDMPAETAASMRNGWFHSGDRGYRDEDGFFYFVDRKKESIRRRGENISSYEVELAISQHPAVLEVAVVPYPSELGEDDVLAFVVQRDGATIDEEGLVVFCEGRMARFMVPRYICFIDRLPKTPSEKIEKYKLKRQAEDNPGQLWDRLTCVNPGERVGAR
jgi:crotonobetaine/carnitine-CoA ligase